MTRLLVIIDTCSGQPTDTYRYILPLDIITSTKGWGFKEDRDYLLPIQSRMLSLTKDNWKQNPGW